MRILKEDSVGVVVDVQERLFPHIYEHDQLAVHIRKLVRGLKLLDVPLIVTEQYTKGLGSTIPLVHEVLEEYAPIEKMSFSCCGSPDFLRTLYGLGRGHVILMGIETHVCVMQTALDLLENGYIPVVVTDCVSSRKEHDRTIAIERMQAEGALVATYESILFELCKEAGNETFKGISQLVK